MAIQCVDRRYVVTIKGFGRGRVVPLIGIAATREDAQTLEAEMIAARRANLPWPSSQPAKGTLAAALDEAWGRSGGSVARRDWHSKRCGPAIFPTPEEHQDHLRLPCERQPQPIRSSLSRTVSRA